MRPPIYPQIFDFFKKALFEFCWSSRPSMETKRPDSLDTSERVLLVERKKNFFDESSHTFFRGAEELKKSKKVYCYKCSKFEKRQRASCEGLKMLLRKKYLKKIKNRRFFWGSHFVLVGWDSVDFCFFYYGIGSAYPELPVQVEVEIWLSIKMCPLGAPRPPATEISMTDSSLMQHS